MKSAHFAAVIAAAALGCAVPAWAVNAGKDVPDSTVQGHADQTHQQSAITAPSSKSSDQPAQSQSDQSKSGEHPPTAAMDRAMPAEKSTEEGASGGKHPPSRAMEQALPDQKAPGSNEAQKAGAQR